MELNRLTRRDLQHLAQESVTTTGDLSEMFHLSRQRAAKLAYDLRTRGFLVEVKKGLYASVPLDIDPKGFTPDPFLVVQKAMGEGYAFSHLSALALLGFEQAVRKIIHVTKPGVRARRRRIGHLTVHVHSTRKEGWESATTRVPRGGGSLRVTTPERTLLDLTALPNSAQDYEEVLEAYRSLLPRTDIEKLLGLVIKNPSVTTRARMGHLLSVMEAETSVSDKVLSAIQESVKRASPIYFATRPHSPSNKFDRRFKVIYPGRD